MSQELESHCKKEIQDLLDKKLIRSSKSPWSCSAFYVMNQAEIERGAPRLKKNPKPWTEEHTKIVKNIKDRIKELPCLNIPHPEANLIVETDASDIGYGGMNPDKRIVIPRPILLSPSSPRTQTQNRFTPLIPTYSSVSRPRNRPPYSPLAHLQGIPPTISPYNRSPTSVSLPVRPKYPSINTEVQFHTNHHKQTIKILEPFEEQKLNQGFPVLLEYLWPKNTNFYTNDFQNREYYKMILIDTGSIQVKHNFDPNDPKVIKFSKVKINKILSPEDWGNRAFTIKVLSKFPEWPGSSSPSCSTEPTIKDDSNDIAKRIRDCKEEDLARIISEIRSSPSTSDDLFQDSQDPYDM
ncbi:enzymatic polyprotein [Tanacetum coccineum]